MINISFKEELTEKIKLAIGPILQEMDGVLVELNIDRKNQDIVIEVIADRSTGGITIDECSRINKELIKKIENRHILEDNYSVEVSSPGLDRLLKTKEDFLRVLNREIIFFLTEPVEEKREYKGKLKEVSEQAVIVDCEDGEITIPIGVIHEAVQAI